MSASNRLRNARGFTLIEIMIATVILVIGLSAMAALAAVMLTRGRQSRYINVAETLASEKLEDLNRYDMAAPQICVQTGDTTEGSLSTQLTTNITCPGAAASTSVSYFDFVSIDFVTTSDCGSANNGCFAETVYNGTTSQYLTTYHSPDGVIPGGTGGLPVTSTTAPTNMTTYVRTWQIEYNPTLGSSGQNKVTGTRRITVLVTNTDNSVKPPVTLQMSLVRQ
jgi:prepilin-type N-terminal cleavage/methylation domain-containing protein